MNETKEEQQIRSRNIHTIIKKKINNKMVRMNTHFIRKRKTKKNRHHATKQVCIHYL